MRNCFIDLTSISELNSIMHRKDNVTLVQHFKFRSMSRSRWFLIARHWIFSINSSQGFLVEIFSIKKHVTYLFSSLFGTKQTKGNFFSEILNLNSFQISPTNISFLTQKWRQNLVKFWWCNVYIIWNELVTLRTEQ